MFKDEILNIINTNYWHKIKITSDKIILMNDVQIPFSKIINYKYQNNILTLYGDTFVCDIKQSGAFTLQRLK